MVKPQPGAAPNREGVDFSSTEDTEDHRKNGEIFSVYLSVLHEWSKQQIPNPSVWFYSACNANTARSAGTANPDFSTRTPSSRERWRISSGACETW